MKITQNAAIIALCLVVLIAGSLIQIFYGYNFIDSSAHKWGSDDAFISYRYAHNLMHGDGLVFNPGERVEGYTNLLYTLLVSPAALIPNLTAIYVFSMILNLLFLILAYSIFMNFIKSKYGSDSMLLAAILLSTIPALWAAVASGLESTFVLLIQVVIWIALDRYLETGKKQHLSQLIIFAVFSLLARADGFVFPIIVCAALGLKGKWRDALLCGVIIMLALGAHILWRYSYYGYPLPNTFYVRVSGPLWERIRFGVRSLASLGLRSGLVLYLIIPMVVGLRLIREFRLNRLKAFASIPIELFLISGWLVYWAYIGGDIYYERFLLLLFPLGISLLVNMLHPLKLGKTSKIALTGAMIALQLIPLASDRRFRYSTSQYDCFIKLGKFIGQRYQGKVMATSGAGKPVYYSGLKTIDMYGLNDIFIGHKKVDSFDWPGHNKYDMDYVVSRKPDIIATFINSNLGIFNEYGRSSYDSAGYEIRYLINTSKWQRPQDIIDVQNVDTDSIVSLIKIEYDFAILERQADSPPDWY
jgi:arabinofuranosyltransferase